MARDRLLHRTAHHCLVLLVSIFVIPQIGAQTVVRLPELDHPIESDNLRVNCEATVNFWNAKSRQLVVQDEQTTVFVSLPEKFYRNNANWKLGTRLKIKGRFDTDRHVILADGVEEVGMSTPAAPIEVSAGELKQGQFWSRRISLNAFVECAMLDDDQLVLVMRRNNVRFYLFRLGKYSLADATKLIDSNLNFTGTLGCVVDSTSSPGAVVCQSMQDDRFETIPSTQSSHEGVQEKLDGQIGFIRETGVVSVEHSDGTACRVYAPFAAFTHPGDLVEVHVVSGEEVSDLKSAFPVFTNDKRGVDCPLVCKILVRKGSAPLAAAKRTNAAQVIAKQLFDRRVEISGEVVAYESYPDERRIVVNDQEQKFHITIIAGEADFETLEMHLAKKIRATGLVCRSTEDNSEFTIAVNDIDSLRIEEQLSTIEPSTVVGLSAGLTCLILGGLVVFLHLRSQVSNRERDLAQVVARLNSTYGAIREAILVIDDNGVVIGLNSRVNETLSLSPKRLQEVNDDENSLERVRELLAECFEDHRGFESLWNKVKADPDSIRQIELNTSDTPTRTLSVYTAPVDKQGGYSDARIWTFDDITDRKSLETNLLQSQKMEAVGRLAGGVAHDFNNLLMAMMANLEVARLDPGQTIEEADEYLTGVEESAHRAARLIKHLLGFSRKASLDMKVASPNSVIEGMRNLLQRTLDVDVTLTITLDQTLGHIKADVTQLEQVLLNICLNARDSFGGKSGTIAIETFNIAAADLPIRFSPDPNNEFDSYVCIRISDNGSGIPEDILDRIFDPFFTTKDPDKGTGLGLAMSFGIMEQHNGFIHCTSELNTGTQFQLLLPQTSEQPELISVKKPAAVQTTEIGHVLLADDNEAVGQSTSAALRAHGFSVTVVTDGKQAVDFVDANRGIPLVAILDLSMPIMSGTEAFNHIMKIDAEIPVVLYSGYVEEFSASFKDASALPFAILQKPFRMQELIETVGSAIADHYGSDSAVTVG